MLRLKTGTSYNSEITAVFTLEDEHIVWTDKSLSDEQIFIVRLMRKRGEQIFRRTNRLIFGRLERRFFPDDLSVETDKSTSVRHKFTSDGQMPNALSVQTIYSSSSMKTFPDDLSVETDKSTKVRHKFTSDGQMPNALSVQTICSSISVKTAI